MDSGSLQFVAEQLQFRHHSLFENTCWKMIQLVGSEPATFTRLLQQVSLPEGKRVHSSRGEECAFISWSWKVIDAFVHVSEEILAFEQL